MRTGWLVLAVGLCGAAAARGEPLYSVQVASAADLCRAQALVERCPADLRREAFVYRTAGGAWTVRVGAEGNPSRLRRTSETLRARGFRDAWIVRSDERKVPPPLRAAADAPAPAAPDDDTGTVESYEEETPAPPQGPPFPAVPLLRAAESLRARPPAPGGAADWGGTGLLRIPTARLLRDGDLRVSLSRSNPYLTFAAGFGLYPFLEVDGRITSFPGESVTDPGFSGYGSYKDKSADFKLMLLSETKWTPALCVGSQDFFGTRLFSAGYWAASKTIGNLDVTVGRGGGMPGGVFSAGGEDRELAGFFGGVEWRATPRLSLIAEYDPTPRPARNPESDAKSRWNAGVKWRPRPWLELGCSFERGSEAGVSAAVTYPLGAPLGGRRPDDPFYGPLERSPLVPAAAETGILPRLEGIRAILAEEGFPAARVGLSEDLRNIFVEFSNERYLSPVKALGRVLRVVCLRCPRDVERVHAIVRRGSLPLLEVSVEPERFIECINGGIDSRTLLRETNLRFLRPGHWALDPEALAAGAGMEAVSDTAFSLLKIEPYLNDPAGFWKGRAGPAVQWTGAAPGGPEASVFVRWPLLNATETAVGPLTDEPIRSDIARYLERTGPVVEHAAARWTRAAGDGSFRQVAAGWLELQFAGVSAERLRFFGDGRLAVGSELSWVRKRSPELLSLEEFSALVPLVNAYVFSPGLETTVKAAAGRFLGGDPGVRLQVERRVRGASVYFWYAKTRTGVFPEGSENRGYSDKGVGLSLPIRVFKDRDCPGWYSYALSPWSRDTGQTVGRPFDLYETVRDYTPAAIAARWDEIVE